MASRVARPAEETPRFPAFRIELDSESANLLAAIGVHLLAASPLMRRKIPRQSRIFTRHSYEEKL